MASLSLSLEMKTRETEELWTLNSSNDEKIRQLSEELAITANEAAQLEETLEISESKNDELAKELEVATDELNILRERRDTLSFELAEKETIHDAEVAALKANIEQLQQQASADNDALSE